MRKKICIISETLKHPLDEGVKLFAFNISKELSVNHTVIAFSHATVNEQKFQFRIRRLPKNKLLLSIIFCLKLKYFRPDIIFYIPPANATVFSFIRLKILQIYCPKALTALITLQPRNYCAISKRLIPVFIPDLVFAQSFKTKEKLDKLGCKTKIIKAGVNLKKFVPVKASQKEKLRVKYKLPIEKYIVLHVGHINRNRNIDFMKMLTGLEQIQAVVVGSTSYPEDENLSEELHKLGVVIINKYIKNIEQIYQCADCYVFPVFSESACIEIPLSIFEAMACNLPVITTRYGPLPELIKEQDGFFYADDEQELLSKVKLAKNIKSPGTRKIVEKHSWKKIVNQLIKDSLL